MKPTIVSVILLACAALGAAGCARPDASARQPIAFSHATHAGRNGIACQYCHGGVRRSPAAGIPSERLCMGCHQLVAANRPEIVKLRGMFQNNVQIEWLRINDIPDFVYFNHPPHIARGIPCRKCHGEIETMAETRPAINLASMAWCVECHRQNNGPVDCYTCHR